MSDEIVSLFREAHNRITSRKHIIRFSLTCC
jgi:hypothetical protein